MPRCVACSIITRTLAFLTYDSEPWLTYSTVYCTVYILYLRLNTSFVLPAQTWQFLLQEHQRIARIRNFSIQRLYPYTNLSDSTKPWILPSESCGLRGILQAWIFFFNSKFFRNSQLFNAEEFRFRCIPFNPGPTRVYSSGWAIHLMTDELTPSGGWNILYLLPWGRILSTLPPVIHSDVLRTSGTSFWCVRTRYQRLKKQSLHCKKPVLGQRCSTKKLATL